MKSITIGPEFCFCP